MKYALLGLALLFLLSLPVASPAAENGDSLAREVFSGEEYEGLDREYKDKAGQGLYDNARLEDLASYLREAAYANPELQAAFFNWKAALEKAAQVSTLPDPRFTFGYYIEPVETRTGPQRSREALTQTFPWFGKLSLKGDEAARRADELGSRFEALKLKIFYGVRQAYYEYAYLGQAIKITEEQVALVRFLENIASARYSSGAGPYSDVTRPQVELGKLEDRLRTLEDFRTPLMAKLNAAMNRPVTQEVPMPESIPVMEVDSEDSELLAMIDDSNPEIEALRQRAAGDEAAIGVARKNFYPDITLGIETIQTDSARGPGDVSGSGNDPVIASISLNLPIWFESRQAALREAKNRLRATERQRRGLTQSLSVDMQLAMYKYREAARKMNLYKETLVPQARQSLNVTLEAFQAGTGSSLDLLDAERTLMELTLAYHRALADQAQRLAEMEMLLGKEIPCTIKASPISSRQGAPELTTKVSPKNMPDAPAGQTN